MKMHKKPFFFLFPLLVLAVSYGHSDTVGTNVLNDGPMSYQSAPNDDTPLELKKAWLQFHEENLCQKIDAVFSFSKGKMEVWVNDKGEKEYRKFLKLFEPFKSSYHIEVHSEEIEMQRGSTGVGIIPASFRLNSELQSHFYPSYLINNDILNLESPVSSTSLTTLMMNYKSPMMVASNAANAPPTSLTASIMHEQSLLAFAQETLQYNWKIKLYSSSLYALALVATDSKEPSEIRGRALAVCQEHARKLQTYEKKLMNNLLILLPNAYLKKPETNMLPASIKTKASASDIAAQLDSLAKSLFGSVHRFIYKQNPTVTLEDLRHPPLIQSLETIQSITEEFRIVVQ
jgi:hypothetical protein